MLLRQNKRNWTAQKESPKTSVYPMTHWPKRYSKTHWSISSISNWEERILAVNLWLLDKNSKMKRKFANFRHMSSLDGTDHQRLYFVKLNTIKLSMFGVLGVLSVSFSIVLSLICRSRNPQREVSLMGTLATHSRPLGPKNELISWSALTILLR